MRKGPGEQSSVGPWVGAMVPPSMADTRQLRGCGLQGRGAQLSRGRGLAHPPPCCQGPLRDSPQAPPGSSTHPHPCLEPTRRPRASSEEVRQKERRTEKESPLNFLPQTRLPPRHWRRSEWTRSAEADGSATHVDAHQGSVCTSFPHLGNGGKAPTSGVPARLNEAVCTEGLADA